MLLPKNSKNDILKELDELIDIGESLIESTKHARAMEAEHLRRSGIVDLRSDRFPPDRVKFGAWETRIKILARRILDESDYQDVLNKIQNAKETLNVASVEDILGILIGRKTAFESGSLDHVFKSTITNTVNEHANSLNDPHEQPAPEDMINRVWHFARDLAWGADNGLWGTSFHVAKTAMGEEVWILDRQYDQHGIDHLIKSKWGNNPPESSLLEAHGFLKFLKRGPSSTYILTSMALDLLKEKKPSRPLQVFISYKQSESAAFASFLERGLEGAGLGIDVFTDRKIRLGDPGEERLEQAVRDCDVFICLFGMTTLNSKWVLKEIGWAVDFERRIIPIWHNGYKGQGNYPEALKHLDPQRPPVYEENTKGYRFTLIDLLDTLEDLTSPNTN